VGITIFSGSLYAVCFFPPIVFGLYGRVASAQTTLVSMILGMSTLILWIALGLNATLHEVFPALLVSASVYWFQASKEIMAEV
jgi:Na+/pantothenate symporter